MKKLSIIAVAIVVLVAGIGLVGFGQNRKSIRGTQWEKRAIRGQTGYSAEESDHFWMRLFDGPGQVIDQCFSLAPSDDNGYVIAGLTLELVDVYHTFAAKFSPTGKKEWGYVYLMNDFSRGYSICKKKNGGYLLAGRTHKQYQEESNGPPAPLISLLPNGQVQWAVTLHDVPGIFIDSAVENKKGDILVTGLSLTSWATDDFENRDLWAAKLTKDGDLIWQIRFFTSGAEGDSSSYDRCASIVPLDDGGCILSVDTSSFGVGWTDILLIRLDSEGKVVWQQAYGGKESEWLFRGGPHIQVTNDNRLYLACYTLSFGARYSDVLLLKLFLNDGRIEWSKMYGGSVGDQPNAIVATSDGGCAVAASSNSWSGSAGNIDFWLFKVFADGTLDFEKAYDVDVGGSFNEAKCVGQTVDGSGYYVAGFTGDVPISRRDNTNILVLKTSLTGDVGPENEYVSTTNASVVDVNVDVTKTDVVPVPTGSGTRQLNVDTIPLHHDSILLWWSLNQPPSNVSLSSVTNEGFFQEEPYNQITWEPNPYNSQYNIIGYKVYRKERNSVNDKFELLTSTSSTSLSYIDANYDTNESYGYAVSSVDAEGVESPVRKAVSK